MELPDNNEKRVSQFLEESKRSSKKILKDIERRTASKFFIWLLVLIAFIVLIYLINNNYSKFSSQIENFTLSNNLLKDSLDDTILEKNRIQEALINCETGKIDTTIFTVVSKKWKDSAERELNLKTVSLQRYTKYLQKCKYWESWKSYEIVHGKTIEKYEKYLPLTLGESSIKYNNDSIPEISKTINFTITSINNNSLDIKLIESLSKNTYDTTLNVKKSVKFTNPFHKITLELDRIDSKHRAFLNLKLEF